MTNKGNTLNVEQTLYPGDYLSSGNGYYAVMQEDGNFVLYETDNWSSYNAKWNSETA